MLALVQWEVAGGAEGTTACQTLGQLPQDIVWDLQLHGFDARDDLHWALQVWAADFAGRHEPTEQVAVVVRSIAILAESTDWAG